MSRLTILVGTIGSGKSTFAKRKAKSGALVINDDDIVNMLHAGEYAMYDKSLKTLYKSIETAIFLHSVSLDREIVVDKGLNISKMARMRWIALATSLEIPITIVKFPFCNPETHGERRFNSDSRGLSLGYWNSVARTHIELYQDISQEELLHCTCIELSPEWFNNFTDV